MFTKSYKNLNLTKLTFVLICFFGSSSVSSADTKIDIGSSLIEKSGIIEANSEKLKIDSNSGTATFSGNVEIKRGQISLKAQEIIVSYSLNKDSTQSITEILATKDVSFVSNQDITKADKAIYDLKTNIIELSGNVSIRQGTSNFSGNKLIFNLNTGKGSISGRVKAILGSDD